MKLLLLFAALIAAQPDFGDPIFSQSATFLETSNPGTQRNDDDPCFLYEVSTPGLTFGTLTITELCCTDKSQPIDPDVKNANIQRDEWFTLYRGNDPDNNPALDCELRFTDSTQPEEFFDTIFVYIYPNDDGSRDPLSATNTEKLTADPIPDQLNILSPPPISTGDFGANFVASATQEQSPRELTVRVFNEVLTEQLEENSIQISRPSGTYTETLKTGQQRNDNDPCFIWDQVVPGETLGTLTMTELCCTDKSVPVDAIIGANIERSEWFDLFTSDDTTHNPGLDCELRFVDSELPGAPLDTIFVYQYPLDNGARITFGSGVTPDIPVVQKLTSDPQPIQLNVFAPPPTSTGDLGDGFDGSDDSPRTIHIDVFGGKNQRKVTPAAPTAAFVETQTHGTQVNDGDDCFIFDVSTQGLTFGSLSLVNMCCADKSNPVDGSQNHGVDRDDWFDLYNSNDDVNNPAIDCELRFEDKNLPGTFLDTIFVFQFPLDDNSDGRVTTSPPVVQKLTSDPIPLQLNVLAPPPSATGDLGTFFNDIAANSRDTPRIINVQVSDAQERKSISDVNVPAPTGGFVETNIDGEQVNDGDPCKIYKNNVAGIDFDGLHITELCCTDKSVPTDAIIGANIGRDAWFQLFRSGDNTHNPGLDCELRFTDKDQPDADNLDTIFVYQYPLQNGRRITFGSGVTPDTPVVQKLTSDPIPDKLNIFSPPPTSTGDLGDYFTGSLTQEFEAREIFITVFAAKDIIDVDDGDNNNSGASAGATSSSSTGAVLAIIFIALTIVSLAVFIWHFKCRARPVPKEQGVALQDAAPYTNLSGNEV